MKSQQNFQLLLETPIKQTKIKNLKDLQLSQDSQLIFQEKDIRKRLKQVLQVLHEQKNQFLIYQQKQQQSILQKIHKQKDQIIEQLLKTIYNLKRQNQQLKFQYRKRFKVIKNIQTKYENLIENKNKKINQTQSIIKYLEGKVKYFQNKLGKLEAYMIKQASSVNKIEYSSKSPHKSQQNYNKISLIISKQKTRPNYYSRICDQNQINAEQHFRTRNSLEEMTIPLKSSFVSQSKASSSSKTLTKKYIKQKQNYSQKQKANQYSESIVYTQMLLDGKGYDAQTYYQDASRIRPCCLDKSSLSSNYQSVHQFQHKEEVKKLNQHYKEMRRSQQINGGQTKRHENRFRLNK